MPAAGAGAGASALLPGGPDLKRETCAACGGPLRDFLDLGSSPPADKFPASPDAQETWYPLQVAVCTECWLAQLREVVPDSELYGGDYGFRTGSSPAAVRYFGDLAGRLMNRYGKRLTVEIGCNDGTLLRHFARAGYPVLGIDPAPGALAEAALEGITVLPALFSKDLSWGVRDAHGPAGLVIACNVAAHVTDPRDFLAGVAALLAPDGVAVIEFQDLEKLIAGCQADHVYHEHRFFYSLRSFSRLAGRGGLSVADWERTPAQGGSLRVTLVAGQLGPAGGTWLETWAPYADMQDRAEYAGWMLMDMIRVERGAGRVVAGWGASAKSATLLNWCGIVPELVPWIEDITPGKIGRYAPGSRIPVRAPGTRPDTYLMTSWNYLPDVIRRPDMREFCDGGGRLIVPGPVPVLL